jgi:hypothetical protein
MDEEEELIGATSSVTLLKRGYGDKAIHRAQAIPFTENMAKRKKHTTSLTDGR